jgi:hypothetical protein
VISYELYCQIQLYYKERGLSFAQIGRDRTGKHHGTAFDQRHNALIEIPRVPQVKASDPQLQAHKSAKHSQPGENARKSRLDEKAGAKADSRKTSAASTVRRLDVLPRPVPRRELD